MRPFKNEFEGTPFGYFSYVIEGDEIAEMGGLNHRLPHADVAVPLLATAASLSDERMMRAIGEEIYQVSQTRFWAAKTL